MLQLHPMVRAVYKISVDENVIFVDMIGAQTTGNVLRIRKEIENIIKNGGPRDILGSVQKAGVPSRETLKVSVKFLREVPFDRVAVYGNNKSVMLVVNLLLKASGSNDRFKFFRNEEDARAWLVKGSRRRKMKRFLRKTGK
jgi:hypothetical protein